MFRFAVLVASGLVPMAFAESHSESRTTPPSAAPPPATTAKDATKKRVDFPGQEGLAIEIEGERRRVLVSGSVVLREGALELLATMKGGKEHESILAIPAAGEAIHTLLLAAGADITAARPFQGGATPVLPKGSKIRVTARYNDGTRDVEVPAQQWIRNAATKKTLGEKWVFTGSRLVAPLPGAKDRRPRYAADIDGDFFSVSNFEASILDLPIESSADNRHRTWEANTEKIPPVGTKVELILEVEKD